MRLPLRPLSALLGALSLVAAACAGDDGDSDSNASMTATSTDATTMDTSTSDTTTSDTTTTDASTTDATTTSESTSTTTETTAAGGPSFEMDVYPNIMPMKCGCHVDLVSGGLAMPDAPTAYANLVGVPASGLPTMSRVSPGDLAGSYLDHKINATHLDVGGMGSKMPLGDSLTPEQLMAIEDWILGGAAP
ncbi:MAG: hypothetical protein R3B09_10250 [Nannocystaceae bacterium]